MNVIIQCAATKRADAGTLLAPDGTPVMFVANPAIAPPRDDLIYARPDDPTTDGGTWRKVLVDYNQTPDTNPLGLMPAIELYRHPVYQGLASPSAWPFRRSRTPCIPETPWSSSPLPTRPWPRFGSPS